MIDALLAWLEPLRAATEDATLLALRLGPLVLVSPALGLRHAPVPVRTGVWVLLTASLTPLAVGRAAAHGPLAMATELLFGVVFALVASAPLLGLELGGRLADHGRGATASELGAPQTSDRSSPLGVLASVAGLAIFAQAGGLTLALATLARTLTRHPLGAPLEAGFARHGAEALLDALTLSVLVGAPVLVLSVVVDLTLAAFGRAAARLPAHFLAMPLRAVAGLAVFSLGLSAALSATQTRLGRALDVLSGLVGMP